MLELISADWTQYVVEAGFNGFNHYARLRFPNGYGASIIRSVLRLGFFSISYGASEGKFELAVLDWTTLDKDGRPKITYDTPITGDVIGWLEPADIPPLLAQIMALPERPTTAIEGEIIDDG